MPDIFDQYVHPKTEVKPIIYAYSDTRWPGCLKIGYTTRTIDERMAEHYPTLTPTISYKVEYVESALYPDGTSFMDHDVHKVLQKKGMKVIKASENGKTTEWYKCTVNDVKAAVLAVKTHSLNEENRTETFAMRPEQLAAVNMTEAYFTKAKKDDPNHTAKFLWNCKMRFGKTFTSYELAKRMGLKKVLILTFKPAVEDSWETDLLSHVDFEGWQFYSRKTELQTGLTPDDLDNRRPIVCFGSFQDYLGTNAAGGIKAKNEWVHTTNWDLVIFDEYHYGAWRDNAKKLFDPENEDEYDTLDLEKYAEKELLTRITSHSFRSQHSITCSFLELLSVRSTTVSSWRIRSIPGHIPTNRKQKLNGRTFRCFQIINRKKEKPIRMLNYLVW